MSIVKGYSKQNDTTYFYEQDYKWNPVTKRPEGTRKLIGKLDPSTGKMIPTGRKGRPKKDSGASASGKEDMRHARLQGQIDELTRRVQDLSSENDDLKLQVKRYEKKIQAIVKAINS